MKSFIKKTIFMVILASLLYDVFIWTKYKEQENIYYSEMKLNLAPICNKIMQDRYRQYLGPVDFAKNEPKGYIKLIAAVYYPNMAPQNIYCSIHLDKFWIGYDENTVAIIYFSSTDYALNGSHLGAHAYPQQIKTTLKKLRHYTDAPPILPRKKPTFDSTLDEQTT